MSQVIVVGWERALLAAEKVKERLRRAIHALDAAHVPYAVVGGNAVAEGVASRLMSAAESLAGTAEV